MQRDDYQEAWSWVHFMLHDSPETRLALTDYLADLRRETRPRPISERLADVIPRFESRFVSYVASLHSLPAIDLQANVD